MSYYFPSPSPSPLSLFIFLISLLCFIHFSSSSTTHPDRYLKSRSPSLLRQNSSEQYFELTTPLPSDPLNPSCSLLLLQEDFGNTIGSPPVSVPYSPPSDCPGPWTQIFLEFSASCQGEQYDRISGVWLDGVELLRTSTAEPTESGIFWNVRKDVTRYSSLFVQSNLTLTVMLENVVNDEFTGVYHVNVSLLYYGGDQTRVSPQVTELRLNRKLGFLPESFVVENSEGRLGFQSEESEGKILQVTSNEPGGRLSGGQKSELFYERPADLIIPISDDGDEGFWFRIQNESNVHSKAIEIPPNTQRAILEIYVSFHGNDEFWYSNPPNSYLELNNLTTQRGNGAFRQVFATIDGAFVGSTSPFPVIFTGGINPLFWEPIVAIGAFNLPSYDVDLTPFLGFLLDGKTHTFGLGVTDSIPFWLVDANLHLWLDQDSPIVQAKSVLYQSSPLAVKRESKFKNLDGSFEIEAKKKTEFSGWVNSSSGNFTTRVMEEFKFKNSIKFKRNGQEKEVEQKIKVKTEIRIESDAGHEISKTIIKRKYPLKIVSSTLPGADINTYLIITNVSHGLEEKSSCSTSSNEEISSSVHNSQDSGGWMVVQDHSVLYGAASTTQTLSYKDKNTCYSRTVAASNGKVLEDNSTLTCLSSY
ncbi:Peptide-N4-(N-acetyl-beta-glucosaminyl)asparagine amidase A [Macleaya cordata]|uniref:Peptide-N4-(N-acetyl-beta-glucosaminyl)asparagine amidase A n=1 Tax=Macleaya cordata TaxID=56857 RepID=A0A200PX65_MACCD|nr:Peptide-N4-(N-acetyl-beta-glucosaminyl)asparagine amidase A [Macleaya cordata]